jgi:hypothetical protein
MKNQHFIHKSALTVILMGFLCFAVKAQESFPIKVVDVESNEALAFATIASTDYSMGFITDVDGVAKVPISFNGQSLVVKYVGYKTQEVFIDGSSRSIVIKLTPESKKLEEVTVYAGENPAHRIIRRLVEKKDELNPEKMPHYSLISYNHIYLGTDHFPETSSKDSAYLETRDLLSDQYLFSLRSKTARFFEAPSKQKEIVLSNRVSGFQNPQFAAMAKSVQDIGFFEDYITVFDLSFLNPLSKNSFGKYFFSLEDSVTDSEGRKSYVITFEPEKDNFNALAGTLYIDAQDFSLRNVVAETRLFNSYNENLSKGKSNIENPSERFYNLETYITINFRIQQTYSKVDGQQWFPVQQKADILFGEFSKKDAPAIPIYLSSRSEFTDISLGPIPDSIRFDRIRLEYDSRANELGRVDSTLLANDSLSTKEERTFSKLDSIFEANKVEKRLALFTGLIDGAITWGKIDFDIANSIRLNEFERVRLGLGLSTSDNFSKWLEVGGYFGYGIRDKGWKYGGFTNINILTNNQLTLNLNYQQDLRQFGHERYYRYRPFNNSSETIYPFIFDEMLQVEKYELALEGYFMRYVNGRIQVNQQEINHPSLVVETSNNGPGVESIDVTEVSANIGITPGEDFLAAFNRLLPTTRSNFYLGLNITRGIQWLDGQYSYTRLSGKIQRRWKTRNFGFPTLTLIGGTVAGSVPSTQLFAIRGSNNREYLDISQTFRTMGVSEFLGSTYVAAFYEHQLTMLTIHPKWSKPTFYLLSSWAYGTASDISGEALSRNPSFRYLDDHYMESGILIKNILRFSTLSFGAGFAYRYGPYAESNWQDNLALRLDLSFSTGE